MTDKIKSILLELAEDIVQNKDTISIENIHVKVQKLYEISSVYHFLATQMKGEKSNWTKQESQLDEILDALSLKEAKSNSNVNTVPVDNFEVPTVMDTIKNLVTEIPEVQDKKAVFEHLDESPIFVRKEFRKLKKELPVSSRKKNLNDLFNKEGLQIDLNDRLAFIKNLFGSSQGEYQRVISQIVTFSDFDEVNNFITNIVKPEYNQWLGKEIFEERFLKIVENYFNSAL